MAYFYCNRSEESRREAVEVLRSFVKQLATRHSKDLVHGKVLSIYKQKRSTGFASKKLGFQEAEQLIHELIRTVQPVTFILDALDECHEKERTILIDFFNRLVESFPHTQVKILVSSRRNIDIKRQLEKEANVGIEATHIQKDIAMYVTAQITKEAERRNKQGMEPISDSLVRTVVYTLLRKSQGM